MKAFTQEDLLKFKQPLDEHQVYKSVQSLSDLRIFMEHHVYCVWDFMSLLKFLQSDLAPVTVPWMPSNKPNIQRLINEIVLEEETDELPGGGFISHFDMYLAAMKEVGADLKKISSFLKSVETLGLDQSLDMLPPLCKQFTSETFSFIQPGNVHIVAVAFCIGRENLIPCMFSRLVSECGISEKEAPMFHYYLKRHIEIDGDKHGPMAVDLLNQLCNNDPDKIAEARYTAVKAVEARVDFLDSLHSKLQLQTFQHQ